MKNKKILGLVAISGFILTAGAGICQAVPKFASNSMDFSNIPFIHAKPRDVWTYEGQGEFEGTSYQRIFSMENVLGVNCLKMVETGIDEYDVSKECFETWCAKDVEGGLWFFKFTYMGVIVFQARNLNELVNFSEVPWMECRLMAGTYKRGDTIVYEGDTEKIVSEDAKLPDYPLEKFVVVKWMDDDSGDVDWEYHHREMGYVLNL